MSLGFEYLVACKPCGWQAQRSFYECTADGVRLGHPHVRCGSCRATLRSGTLSLLRVVPPKPDPPSTAPLDRERYRRRHARRHPARAASALNGGQLESALRSAVTSVMAAVYLVDERLTSALSRLGSGAAELGRLAVVPVSFVCWALAPIAVVAAIVVIIGDGVRASFDVVMPDPSHISLVSSESLADEPAKWCSNRGYLVDVRGADVPESTRELRRRYLEHCVRR